MAPPRPPRHPRPWRDRARLPRILRRSGLVLALVGALVIAGLSAMRYWANEMAQFTFVPGISFAAPPARSPADYADPALWFAQRHGVPGEGPRWRPVGAVPAGATLPAAVFFIHPTSHFDRGAWNAAPDDGQANARAETFLRGLASPFGAAAEVWAPRYRQATLGAFLTDKPEGAKALDAAYGDILAAFDQFAAVADPRLPIVLAGHSQGAFHLMRLMRDRVAGRPIAGRIAAAYVVGWPVSLAHDLPAMGLPACHGADQPGCILSWQSFAEPADPRMVLDAYARFPGLDGQSRKGTPFLCVNPITGRQHSAAAPDVNLGTLVPNMALNGAALVPGLVGARCGGDGFLLIGPPPSLGPLVMPGNNYHVYDIPLFWANTQADVARRVRAWHRAQRGAGPTGPATDQKQDGGWWKIWRH